jgi:hypothetical protein
MQGGCQQVLANLICCITIGYNFKAVFDDLPRLYTKYPIWNFDTIFASGNKELVDGSEKP